MFNTSRNRFILLALSCYFILALAWIFLSDRVLILLTDQDTIVELSTLKGIFFRLYFIRGSFFCATCGPIRSTNKPATQHR